MFISNIEFFVNYNRFVSSFLSSFLVEKEKFSLPLGVIESIDRIEFVNYGKRFVFNVAEFVSSG